ncbi:MAG: gliding motility lipoprotein GldD [Bacteroidales bacterium]|nr:gliding motility lipoprotein GldD [Bacteroidales bacterium]
MKRLFILITLSLFLVACGDPVVPRPRGYFRIELPEPQYVSYDSIGEPYAFEINSLSYVAPDHDANSEPHWINIVYPSINCKVHVTYRPINGNEEEVLEDSRKLVYKHTVKADAIGESYYEDADRQVYGTLYHIKGNAATPLQFSLTDSVRNMFRGSLYFYCRPNSDSLSPVIKYVEDDVVHIIETFQWRTSNSKQK